MNTPRITKDNHFEALSHLLEGKQSPVPYGLTTAKLAEFIQHERDLLAKKNSGDKKLIKTQEQNEILKEKVYTALKNNGGASVTISIMQKYTDELAEMSNQKLSAILRHLVQIGRVDRQEIKRVAYFKAI